MVKWLNITGAIKWIFDNPVTNMIFSVVLGFILALLLRKNAKSDRELSKNNKQSKGKKKIQLENIDVGYDLCATSVISSLMNIRGETCIAGGCVVFFLFLIQFVTSYLVRYLKNGKSKSQKKKIEVLIPLIVGILCLIISCLYIGGVVR